MRQWSPAHSLGTKGDVEEKQFEYTHNGLHRKAMTPVGNHTLKLEPGSFCLFTVVTLFTDLKQML